MNDEDINNVSNISDSLFEHLDEQLLDRLLDRQVQRLIEVQTYLRWMFDGFIWLTVGTASIWALRSDIELWIATFTWAALRITLMYNRFPMMGLGLCVAVTLATLVWQCSIILWGINQRERQVLVEQVKRIQAKGKSHPLWRWVCEEKI